MSNPYTSRSNYQLQHLERPAASGKSHGGQYQEQHLVVNVQVSDDVEDLAAGGEGCGIIVGEVVGSEDGD